MTVAVGEISEQAERLMGMTIVLGELYFSHRMLEDKLNDKDNEIASRDDDVRYWRNRFDLLAEFVSKEGMKKFMAAIEAEQKGAGQ